MIRSMPHKQISSITIYQRAADRDIKSRPHIFKYNGRWAYTVCPGDRSIATRLARDWVRLANFKLENAPCSPAC